MHIGISCEMSKPPAGQDRWRDLWEDHMWFFCEAEQLGFDFVGVQEHPFAQDAHGPSPLVVASTVVARTSTLRVGSWASILPLHHPALLAQQWSALDQLSGGRTFVTVAPGYRRHEYAAFGIDPRTRASRMEEGYELLRKAFEPGPVTHHGEHWDVDDLAVVPGPVQDPYPIWGAAASVPAAQRAGRHRAHLALTSADPAVVTAYRRCLQEQGENPDDYRISLPFPITVTDEDPEAVWNRHRHLYLHRYTEVDRYTQESGDEAFAFGHDVRESDEKRYRTNELIGDPETVLQVLDQMRSLLSLTDIVCVGPAPGIDLRTEGVASLRLLAEEVLPVLRTW